MDAGQGVVMFFWGGIILVALLSWFIWDQRYRKNERDVIPSGYSRTEEIFIDPVDGKKLRVYYNHDTGERLYRSE